MKRNILGTIKNFFDNLKKNRLLYTIFVTAVAFNLVIISSFAWLTLNRKTGVGQMGMSLDVDNTSAVYEAYMYDLETGQGSNLHKEIVVDENGNTTVKTEPLTITNIDLNQYDTIFKGQNKTTPVFAKIKITKSQSMPDEGNVYITIERKIQNEAQKSSEDKGLLTDYTSSIVRFTGFIIHDKTDLTKTTAKELYEFINSSIVDVEKDQTRYEMVAEYQGELDHSKTFVTREAVEDETNKDAHVHRKTDSVTIKVAYTQDDWYKDNEGNMLMNVYLYITYDPTLVDCYMDDHGGGSLSLDHNFIFFENDMTKVTVSYDKLA